LNFLIKKNIIKSQRIKSYKGKRHAQGLPVRGQRTHSNGLTAKRLSFYKIPKNEIKTKIRKKK
jgi:ribosomal protein S13